MTFFPLATQNGITYFLCAVVLALGAACVFVLMRTDRRQAASLSTAATPASPQDASREIKVISEMMRSYIRESRNYSSYTPTH
jgi:hypothetical protein